ncbi:TadE/TadG family type IV pilus assembly protein [Paenibacillus spongiae]|uniref:Pilus assembly protein n=1 Tax=Paenibacillus spongiae TaxID=2909671 RepID=A0ABY5SF91_9BACL|nr:pilus assembly protein [Paenibacillus spongiae]UVI31422.1 pilus assembly protein [Paenibacillus spongiae]
MIKRIKYLVNALARYRNRGEEGSFTLESSLIFPSLFVALLAMLLLGMYVYQKVALYYVASVSAERTVYRWDNSHRDPVSGMAPANLYDGLYWRMGSDGALQSLFQLGGAEEGGSSVAIGTPGEPSVDDQDGDDGSLPVKKMNLIASRVPAPYEGQMRYAFGFIEKSIEVRLRQPLSVPLLEAFGRTEPQSGSRAVIVDPVEFIRNVDLARYYTAKFMQGSGSGGASRAHAAEILNGRKAAEQTSPSPS